MPDLARVGLVLAHALPAGTSPSDAAFGRASSPARVGAYKEWIKMPLLYLSLYNNHAP